MCIIIGDVHQFIVLSLQIPVHILDYEINLSPIVISLAGKCTWGGLMGFVLLIQHDGQVEGPVHAIEQQEQQGEQHEGPAVQGVLEFCQFLLKQECHHQ